jgi:hypothetical protein
VRGVLGREGREPAGAAAHVEHPLSRQAGNRSDG